MPKDQTGTLFWDHIPKEGFSTYY